MLPRIMASLLASLLPTVASTCTDMVIYQPVIAGFLAYQLASGASTIYWVGSSVFYLGSTAVRAGADTAKFIYQKSTGHA